VPDIVGLGLPNRSGVLLKILGLHEVVGSTGTPLIERLPRRLVELRRRSPAGVLVAAMAIASVSGLQPSATERWRSGPRPAGRRQLLERAGGRIQLLSERFPLPLRAGPARSAAPRGAG